MPHATRLFRSLTAILRLLAPALWVTCALAASPEPGPPLSIVRAAGPIVIDGDLSDAGWSSVTPVTKWYETNVGDNVEPQVSNEGYLAYDDTYLYAGFRFADPDPKLIRAPFADHDQLSGSTDYGGVLIDSRNDGKSGILFLANPNGLLYDAVSNDASGEDSSPDYYWDAAGKITDNGWTLEIRIPFSSLRYSSDPVQTWRIMLYRNYPRDRHYQFFSNRLPRDVSCFVCNSSTLTGLEGLPHGSHLVVAPFATAQRNDVASNGLGEPLVNGDLKSNTGVDVKWSPLANLAIDGTIDPDFSQVEADAAQIGANERFALFYPEKRSFFLEGIDLFATPFQAVYTRSINSPSTGIRTTGRIGKTTFTALATRDQGDGLVILPGPEGSDAAFQDFRSDVGVFRARHDLGNSFVSVLATGRDIKGGGNNAVFGPDFNWRPGSSESIKGQMLWSSSRTPNRPDLATEWDGRSLQDHAALLAWSHGTRTIDWYLQGQELGPEFRADEGFIPQVGYREGYAEVGYTLRPKDTFFSRIRLFTINYYDEDYDGKELNRRISAGAGMDGRWNSFFRFELNQDQIKVGDESFSRFRPYLYLQSSPGRVLNMFTLEAYVGDEIDFANARKGSGTTLIGSVTVRPNSHLELLGNASARWLNVEDESVGTGRLFLAQVERLRTTWSFNSRSFLRLIGQYQQTSRDTSLYLFEVEPKTASFTSSALFAYKLNWQTVLYVGYGDERTFAAINQQLENSARGAFAKVSYALQR
jgi:Domain of unknown function (DUF5916)